jgi:DNA invertase Pin-like site-specific DNA recombinase
MMDEQRTWIYSRKSRALGDPDDPALLAAHRAAMLDLARRKGVAVPNANIVMEIGSGETISERPSFQALLHIWERLPLDAGGAVLVPAIDRLSRGSLTEQARVQSALARADIRVWTPGREYDLRDVDQAFVWDIEGLFARRELELFKRRQAAKRAQLLKDGRSANLIPPYPYMVDRVQRTWLPHPQRFAAAQSWCREVYSDSLRTIARRWGVSIDIVHITLRNPAIAGWPRKQYRKEHGKVRKLTREEKEDPQFWPERPGDYPPVVTLEEWRRIQTVLDDRRIRRAKVGTDDNGWCRDVLRFVGYPDLVPSLSVGPRMAGAGGARPPTYQAKPPGLPWLYVERTLVHTAALEALSRGLSNPDILRAVSTYQAERTREETQVVRHATAADLDKQIANARRRLDRLGERDLETDDRELLASNARLRERIGAEIKALRHQLAQQQQEAQSVPALDELLEVLTTDPDALQEALALFVSREDCSGLRVFVRAFIKRIWVEVRLRPGMTRRREREVVLVEFTLPGLE